LGAGRAGFLSSALPYVMAASRFAHQIKVMMRDRAGSFMSRAGVW